MLYVFWVEKGVIITLHVDVAVDTVLNLKAVLVQQTGVTESNQVLLINGGESLQDDQRVARYQSGTDTNPIFLFNRAAIEAEQPEATSSSSATTPVPDEIEAKESIDAVLSLPTNVNSVTSRTQIAQQYVEFAKELNRQCSLLVHEQQLQHQGWQAVMANLEDVIAAFQKRLEKFQQNFRSYLDTRAEKLLQLQRFPESLEILNKIVLFPSVVRSRPKPAALASSLSPEQAKENTNLLQMTILDWVSSKDPEHSLLSVSEGCKRTMEVFDENTLVEVQKEADAVVEFCNQPTRKEIRGLAERLFGLDQLLHEAKKFVVEQKEVAEGIFRLQTQATSTKDMSVLRELSQNYPLHFGQLLKLHSKLTNIKDRCLTAKQELCRHLHARLKWVVAVENSIMEVDDKIKIYFENIKRIRRLTHMLQQVSTASRVYVVAAQEVIRRRKYSKEFLEWATSLAGAASQVYNHERDARKLFVAEFGSHFLLSLFPGLDDLPPAFAITPPDSFDINLPVINLDDLNSLLLSVPDLREHYRSSASTPFVLPNISSSLQHSSQSTQSVSSYVFRDLRPALSKTLTKIVDVRNFQHDLYGDIRDFAASYRHWIGDLSVNHLNELSLKISANHGHLQSRSDQMQHHFRTSMAALREENGLLLRESRSSRTAIAEVQSEIQHLSFDLKRMRISVVGIRNMSSGLASSTVACKELIAQNRSWTESSGTELRRSIDAFGLLFRKVFRLILQLTEESISLQSLVQRKSDETVQEVSRLADEKQVAENALRRQLQLEYEEKLLAVRSEMSAETERRLRIQADTFAAELTVKMDSMRKQVEDEKMCASTKSKQQMEDSLFPQHHPKSARSGSALSEQLSEMERSLTTRDLIEHMSDSQMTASTFVFAPSSSNPLDLRTAVSVSHVTTHQGCITLSSCNVGDLILFSYKKEFKQYVAHLPFKKSLYLLHAESLAALGLHVPENDDSEVQPWLIAEVTGKEYVLTKKIPNRYGLQVGTKFFRVQAKPWVMDPVVAHQVSKGLFERRSDASI